jgi:hypothetical protein
MFRSMFFLKALHFNRDGTCTTLSCCYALLQLLGIARDSLSGNRLTVERRSTDHTERAGQTDQQAKRIFKALLRPRSEASEIENPALVPVQPLPMRRADRASEA